MSQRLSRLAIACAFVAFSSAMTAAQDLYAPRSDWSSLTGGDLNISGFIFRDVNRNGVYDLVDRPMENVATRMTSPQRNTLIRWTNSNGFANFSMSARDPNADVSNPGLYDFDVIVPDAWQLTTGNAHQTKRFEVTPGAIADMSASPPFFPVGIAPILTLSGIVPERVRQEQGVAVGSPDGEWRKAEIGRDGQFRVPVHQGEWQIAMGRDDQGQPVFRTVTVMNAPVQVSAGGGGVDDPPGTGVVVDFEDVTQGSIREMPSGVGGLMWWNTVALKVAPSYTNNAVSGHYVAYNSSGHPARIWSPEPFSFVGGHFGVAWNRAHGETLRLRGYRRGELVYEDSISLSYLGPVWFQADYRDIDRLDLATDHFWQFVMDDVSFVVPERLPTQ
jgi:hypothetical protein